MSDCPSDAVMAEFAQGLLAADQRRVVETHLDSCESCRVLVGGLIAVQSGPESPHLPDSPDEGSAETLDLIGDVSSPELAEALTDEPGPAGLTLGRYVLRAELGRGGFGRIYAAYDPQLMRNVAIKLLHHHALHEQAQRRLLREARAVARFTHPNVVVIHDVGTYAPGDRPYSIDSIDSIDGARESPTQAVFLVMELIEGPTLQTWLAEQTRPWPTVLEVFQQAAEGLAAAHVKGIVHRDFKPSNVMLDSNGVPRVLDFGLAAVDQDSVETKYPTREALAEAIAHSRTLSREGVIMGTPGYMAPEQLWGRPVTPAADQFAFCVSLYQAFYQQSPFAGDAVEDRAANMMAGAIQAPSADSTVPAPLLTVLQRGLAREPTERFPDMRALIDALSASAQRVTAPANVEARAYTRETTTDAEAELVRARISLIEPGLLLYRELPVPSEYAIALMVERLTSLTAGLSRYTLLVDLAEASIPGDDVRRAIRDIFADPRLCWAAVFSTADPVRSLSARLIMEPLGIRFSVHSDRDEALAALRAALDA